MYKRRRDSNKGLRDIWNLVAKGVNTVDREGRTPLILAASAGINRVCKALINNGADINAADNKGHTALSKAINNGHKAVIKLLIKEGADINAADEQGSTPLILAAAQNINRACKALINNGADINAADKRGRTALNEAAANGRKSVVKLLIKKGADIDAVDEQGYTALVYAKDNHHTRVVKILENLNKITERRLECFIENRPYRNIRGMLTPKKLSNVRTGGNKKFATNNPNYSAKQNGSKPPTQTRRAIAASMTEQNVEG